MSKNLSSFSLVFYIDFISLCSLVMKKMERSSYSFTYKGSIPDAINESRNQKKLFMVYISGEFIVD